MIAMTPPAGCVGVTRGRVDQRREVMVASVGVSVATALLLGPEAALADVVVELLHPQATACTRVGTCNTNPVEFEQMYQERMNESEKLLYLKSG